MSPLATTIWHFIVLVDVHLEKETYQEAIVYSHENGIVSANHT